MKGKYCLGGLSNKELVDRFSFTGSADGSTNKFFGEKEVRLISREAYNQETKDSRIPDKLLDFSTIVDFTYRGNGLPISVCIPDTCSVVEINDFLNRSETL